jgi:hypothetical protein
VNQVGVPAYEDGATASAAAIEIFIFEFMVIWG